MSMPPYSQPPPPPGPPPPGPHPPPGPGPGSPRPGSPYDLPPGYTSAEQQAAKRAAARRRGQLGAAGAVLVFVAAAAVTWMMRSEGAQADDLTDLEVGQCYDGEPGDLELVDCGDPHHGEVVGIVPAPDAAPEWDADGRAAGGFKSTLESLCQQRLGEYVSGGPDAMAGAGAELASQVPPQGPWEDGFQDTYCVVVLTSGGTVEGPLRDTGS